MTALAPGRAPRTDAEWAGEITQRVKALENPRSVRVGAWSLVTDPLTGSLKAMRPGQTTIIDGTTGEVEPAEVEVGGGITQADLQKALAALPTTGAAPTNDTALAALFQALTGAGKVPIEALTNLANLFKIEVGEGLENLVNFFRTNVLKDHSPLDAFNIFNVLRPGTHGSVPIASLTAKQVNLLANPEFLGDLPIALNDQGWSIDPDVHYKTVGRSATISATGQDQDLYANRIKVEAGQVLSFSMYVRWTGLVTAAPPVSIKFVARQQVGDNSEITVDTAVVDTDGVAGVSPGWVLLTGEYTVPAVDGDSNVLDIDTVIPVLSLSAAATAGQVWFSSGDVHKVLGEGVAPIGWIAGLRDTLGAADEFTQTLLGVIMSAITGFPITTWLISEFQETVSGWFDDTQHTAGQASDALGYLKDTWDSIVQGWKKTTATGFGLVDVLSASAGQKDELTQMAAGIAKLNADAAAQYVSGNSFKVTVSDYGTTVPSVLTKIVNIGGGTVINDGDTLEFDTNVDGREIFQYNGGVLTTAFFEVSVVVPRWGVDYFGSHGTNKVIVIGRVNAAGTRYCIAEFTATTVRVGCVIDGVTTWFGPALAYKNGAYITFRGGVANNERIFQALVNNDVRASFTDTGNVSLFGPDYLGVGVGIESDQQDGVVRSPNISHITANDNLDAPFQGIGCRLYRANPAGAGEHLVENSYPVDVFDSVARISSQFVIVNLALGEIQFLEEGFYDLQVRAENLNAVPFRSVTVSTPRHHITPYLRISPAAGGGYVDGPKGQQTSSAPDGFGNTLGGNAMYSTWIGIPFLAGDRVRPWYRIGTTISGTGGFWGDAMGNNTWFAISKSGAR